MSTGDDDRDRAAKCRHLDSDHHDPPVDDGPEPVEPPMSGPSAGSEIQRSAPDASQATQPPPAEHAEDAAQPPVVAHAPVDHVGFRSPTLPSQRSNQTESNPSRSMVHGGDINTGISTWRQFIRDNSALADKSLAIADVMDSDYMVCAGLYPRCLGKTTFLDLLYNFLAVVSKVPYSQRREKFTSYAIHEKGPEFFSKHFCRYAVFKLDFKGQNPTTREGIAYHMRAAVEEAATSHVRFLRKLINGSTEVDVGPYGRDDIMEKAVVHQYEIADALNMFDRMMGRQSLSAADIGDIRAVIPLLMRVFNRLFGRGAVVLVDEYDTPFLNAAKNTRLTTADRRAIQQEYTTFLSALLEDNASLRRGVLVGVFDIECLGLGSGMNNIKVHLAHSGMVNGWNPFKRTFGFTLTDVWGLVNHYVDNIWPGLRACANPDGFKRQLLTGFAEHFDGYRIGRLPHIFNPLAVLSFLCGIRDKTADVVVFGGRTPKSMDVLDRYLERLFFLGSQRLVDTAGSGAATEIQSVASVDEAVVRISTEEPPQSSAGSMIAVNNERPMPSIHDVTAVDMEMATIYMRYRAYEFADLRTLCEQPISASKVLWLLYQAGYIVPSNRSQMIIPNAEVLVELRHYQQRVARLHHR